MKRPDVSLVLFVDVEKDPTLLDRFFHSLNYWNADAIPLMDVSIVTQKRTDPYTLAVASRQKYPVDVIHARHDFVGDYPVWDVMDTMRRIEPMLRGRYVYPCHVEFFHCPGRLKKSIDYLRDFEPDIAVGNLRRLDDGDERTDWKLYRTSKKMTEALLNAVDNGNGEAKDIAESLPTTNWAYWEKEPAPGRNARWTEDLFFARRDWLTATRFWQHADRLVFQDLYDLIGTVVKELKNRKFHTYIDRMPQAVHKVIHLWHPKGWDSWTPAMRSYFAADPDRWQGTRLLDSELWDRLIRAKGEAWTTQQPVIDARRSPGGTVNRYHAAFMAYMDGAGKDIVYKYFSDRIKARNEQTALHA